MSEAQQQGTAVVRGKVLKSLLPPEGQMGLIFGYVAVSWTRDKVTKRLEPHFDHHGDNITDDAIMSAALKFSKSGMAMDVMHEEMKIGKVAFQFPLTREVAKAYGLTGDEYGWMVAVQPDSREIVHKFRTGELAGFSLGGHATRYVAPYTEGTCPRCRAPLGLGNCIHQPAETEAA